MRRLCLFYKVVSTKLPAYIYDIIPHLKQSQRHPNRFNSISCRTKYFKNLYFPCIIGAWNKLNTELQRSIIGFIIRFIISMMLSVLN